MARFSMKACMPQERRLAATVIYPAGSDRTDMQRRRPSQIWEPPWSWPISVSHHPRPDHAAYIASWLRVLKADARAIFTLASKAQAAADWMHTQQPEQLSVAA
jgi:antirestriction protein ArdC